jgi:hypothetical protein
MILLAISIAIPNEHARLARLETDAFILAAVGAAVLCRHRDIVHVHYVQLRDSFGTHATAGRKGEAWGRGIIGIWNWIVGLLY